MAIGRSFQESLQKAIRSLEVGLSGFEPLISTLLHSAALSEEQRMILTSVRNPSNERLWLIADAFRSGLSLDEISQLTAIDPWFLAAIQELVQIEKHWLIVH